MGFRRAIVRRLQVIVMASTMLLTLQALAIGEKQIVSFRHEAGAFALAEDYHAPAMVLSRKDWPGVLRAAGDFCGDVASVSGSAPQRVETVPGHATDLIIAGTLGRNPLIDQLASEGKIDVKSIRGQWEAGLIAVVDHPFSNVERALVIAGSDKRGTIFALYTLSEQIGVSPWAWWADVRIPHRDALFITAGPHILPSPVVRYRGIFLNDEAPSLSGWAREKFGGFSHKFYEHVFELLLRLRANYLWPAMWGSAFNEDDPLNPKIADEYGIVMGTSHHEPMLRAQQEWKKHGRGPWDYATNAAELARFWANGIQRNKEYESTITIGMRGDGDMAMSPSVNTALLERIVEDQRKIISAYEDPQKHDPQIWALYKEVQEYYEKGMRVPDDVTLLWSDDNWGNLRRLPTAEERKRAGGAGIYYHLDYVGGPRSYKWLNTYSTTKIWEQMNLAAQYGADRVWIVNVGDLKPMEFPMEFFLTMARDPARWNQNNLEAYTLAWATREFGPEHAAEIADLVARYTKYNSRRKPELLEPGTYSFTEGHEADRVEREWEELAEEAERVAKELPEEDQASFFELVQYPVEACANLGEMYIAAGRNRFFANQERASANFWANQTEKLFARDAELTKQYHLLLNGKWNHMMDQTHIGYKSWNDPPRNSMPEVRRISVPDGAHLGVFAEDDAGRKNELPAFDAVNRQIRAIDFARLGSEPIKVAITSSEPWVQLDWRNGLLGEDRAVHVSIDWASVPKLPAKAVLTVSAEGNPETRVKVLLFPVPVNARGFVEDAGRVTIDAEHAQRYEGAEGLQWKPIPGFGPVLSAIEAFPATAPSTLSGQDQACVDYEFTLLNSGQRTLQVMLAPTLAFSSEHGLRYSIAIDGQSVGTLDAWEQKSDREWAKAVSDGVHRVSTPLGKLAAGPHSLRVCRVDAGLALERILIFESQPLEYLGPPESAQIRRAAGK